MNRKIVVKILPFIVGLPAIAGTILMSPQPVNACVLGVFNCSPRNAIGNNRNTTKPALRNRIETFQNPMVDGYGLDNCREWAQNCGWPAAHAYCHSRGYAQSISYLWVEDNQKTRVINGGQVCDSEFCDRISLVTCED